MMLELLEKFGVGVLLAMLYVSTKNLFILIGIHALIDTPTLLFAFDTSVAVSAILTIIVLVLILAPLIAN